MFNHQYSYLMCTSEASDILHIHPSGMIGLCNPSNQLCQLVRVVLPSAMLAAGAGGYRQSLSTEHCMALRDAVIGQRLDHVRRTAIQGYRSPGDEMTHKVCSVSGALPSAPGCIASLTCI